MQINEKREWKINDKLILDIEPLAKAERYDIVPKTSSGFVQLVKVTNEKGHPIGHFQFELNFDIKKIENYEQRTWKLQNTCKHTFKGEFKIAIDNSSIQTELQAKQYIKALFFIPEDDFYFDLDASAQVKQTVSPSSKLEEKPQTAREN